MISIKVQQVKLVSGVGLKIGFENLLARGIPVSNLFDRSVDDRAESALDLLASVAAITVGDIPIGIRKICMQLREQPFFAYAIDKHVHNIPVAADLEDP